MVGGACSYISKTGIVILFQNWNRNTFQKVLRSQFLKSTTSPVGDGGGRCVVGAGWWVLGGGRWVVGGGGCVFIHFKNWNHDIEIKHWPVLPSIAILA